MICILHGYLLEGSGSNLWTRSIVESLCRLGETVHLVCQENHPERYDFITEARRYPPDGPPETTFRRESPHAGCCILHVPELGDTLPVYVWDRYEEFDRVVPMVELPDAEIEAYVRRNAAAVETVVRDHGVTALHANHAVLMSVVARRVSERTGVPFAVMPHGSALEFAVKRDARLHRMAAEAFAAAGHVFVHGEEMRRRVRDALPEVRGLEEKFSDLHLGVDTARFEPVARAERSAEIGSLTDSLRGMPRGRTAAQTRELRASLHPGLGQDELRGILARAAEYDGKAPDADVEEKLGAVRWGRDPVLLFVGRLISTKGIQDVVAALPLLLEQVPDLRLVVVGHGPLREVLEALLWALEHGDRELVRRIVRRGRVLEGLPEGEGGGAELAGAARFFEQRERRGEVDGYFDAARRHVRPERAIFTGYLTHRELRHLFPCCDAAVFPSVVREAGPLVFLEALASGVFPLGTYFGGMRASIDSVADVLPPGAADAMKLDPDPAGTVADVVRHVPAALALGPVHRDALRQAARERYDWMSVARKLAAELDALGGQPERSGSAASAGSAEPAERVESSKSARPTGSGRSDVPS